MEVCLRFPKAGFLYSFNPTQAQNYSQIADKEVPILKQLCSQKNNHGSRALVSNTRPDQSSSLQSVFASTPRIVSPDNSSCTQNVLYERAATTNCMRYQLDSLDLVFNILYSRSGIIGLTFLSSASPNMFITTPDRSKNSNSARFMLVHSLCQVYPRYAPDTRNGTYNVAHTSRTVGESPHYALKPRCGNEGNNPIYSLSSR